MTKELLAAKRGNLTRATQPLETEQKWSMYKECSMKPVKGGRRLERQGMKTEIQLRS